MAEWMEEHLPPLFADSKDPSLKRESEGMLARGRERAKRKMNEARERLKAKAAQTAEAAAKSKRVQALKKRIVRLADWAAPHKGWEDDTKAAESGDAADDAQAKQKKEKEPVDEKLYRKFELTGKRPNGSFCHEMIGLVIVTFLVLVPGAIVRVLGWNSLWASLDGVASDLASGNLSDASVSAFSAAAGPYTSAQATHNAKMARIRDACDGNSTSRCRMDQLVDMAHARFDFFAVVIGWPLVWLGLVGCALVGKWIDKNFRSPTDAKVQKFVFQRHEVMRFRWEGGAKACYGLLNVGFYAALIAFGAVAFGSNAVTQLLSLVLRFLVGGSCLVLGLALAGMCAKRKLNADCLPNLSEVYQCQLDENFQKLTEGEKEWRKRNQRKALRKVVKALTCGCVKLDSRSTGVAAADGAKEADLAKIDGLMPLKEEAQWNYQDSLEKDAARVRYDRFNYVVVFCNALLISLIFKLWLKLCGNLWFMMRSLISLPLYGFVPRLFYLEWVVHYYQRKVLTALDYPAFRPTKPSFAPFFFSYYLPSIGYRFPGVPRSRLSWPDFDWPSARWPSIWLPDLQQLLAVRFPDIEWPELPSVEWPGLPSFHLGHLLGQLRLRLPQITWPELPELPGLGLAFPDLSGWGLDFTLQKLIVRLPDLNWPAIPEFDLPDIALPDILKLLSVKFPSVEWPTIEMIQLSMPSASLPSLTLPSLRIDLPTFTMPTIDFELPSISLPDVTLPDVKLPCIPVPSIGLPSIALDVDFAQFDQCCYLGCDGPIGDAAASFVRDVVDDVVDVLLVFGTAALLANKAVMRKRREQAHQRAVEWIANAQPDDWMAFVDNDTRAQAANQDVDAVGAACEVSQATLSEEKLKQELNPVEEPNKLTPPPTPFAETLQQVSERLSNSFLRISTTSVSDPVGSAPRISEESAEEDEADDEPTANDANGAPEEMKSSADRRLRPAGES